jgi:lipopolysaccharide transport system permease protein
MYASPVVYPLSVIPEKWHLLLSINPMVGVIEVVRQILFGVSSVRIEYVLIGIVVNLVILAFGILMFNRVEKNFLDTV